MTLSLTYSLSESDYNHYQDYNNYNHHNHYNHYNHYNYYRVRDSDLDLDLGVVIYNQIVTWAAFAILAMFFEDVP